MTEGWICPKCGFVWSPSIFGCMNCNQPVVYKVPKTTGGYYPNDKTTGGSTRYQEDDKTTEGEVK